MSKNVKKTMKLFFDEKAPLHAALEKYEKSGSEIDEMIKSRCRVSYSKRAELMAYYHIEGLLVSYQLGILSANERTLTLIHVSKECDIHKTNQLYLRECTNSKNIFSFFFFYFFFKFFSLKLIISFESN